MKHQYASQSPTRSLLFTIPVNIITVGRGRIVVSQFASRSPEVPLDAHDLKKI